MLFERSIPFIPEWEKVITPVVDFLRRRPDVDRKRIAIAGQSFGGYLVERAAAFEHRLAAVVADPGVTDAFAGGWSTQLPKSMIDLLVAGKGEEFNHVWAEVLPNLPQTTQFDVAKRSEIYSNGSFYERMRQARKFKLTRSVARRIDAPVAVLEPQDEQFFPSQQKVIYDWVKRPKALLRFTVAEGAQMHCEPMAPQFRNERVFDWLERAVR
jgi:dienelactone hydrolase